MTPRPLHTINETQSRIIRSNDDVETAKSRFYDNVAKGISVLVRRHGYSRERAASLILDQIRQSDAPPTEDEVFRVMHHLGLSIEEARQSIIVASALKRVQEQRGVQKVSAIDYLSSCLTTMKLLGSVEKHVAVKQSSVACSPSSTMSEEFMSSTLVHLSPSTTNKSTSATRDRAKTVGTSTCTGRRKNLKNVKSRQLSKPPKPQRKRSKEEDKSPSDKVDAQVVEKALLVNCKTSSPSVRQAGKRVSSHREELEGQSQPVTKRQRLDSV